MNTLFLDFDGVLFDTLKEAYLLCRYSFYGTAVEVPVDEEEYKLFYKYKFLVYNSWQYYYLMKSLNSKNPVQTYKEYLNNRDIESEQEFDRKYYEKRIEMKRDSFEFWNGLEEPFEFFFEVKSIFEKGRIDVVIVSKKDFDSIKMRLNQYGLSLADDKIFAKEQLMKYHEKSDFIDEYMLNSGVERAIFVDDNSHNLRPCKDIEGLKCLLAGWGNIAVGETGLSCAQIINEVKIL